MYLFIKKEFLPIYNIYFIVDMLSSPVLTLLSHFTVVRLQISEQSVSRLKRLTSITCEQARNGLLFGANGCRKHSKPKSLHTCAQVEQWKCQSTEAVNQYYARTGMSVVDYGLERMAVESIPLIWNRAVLGKYDIYI